MANASKTGSRQIDGTRNLIRNALKVLVVVAYIAAYCLSFYLLVTFSSLVDSVAHHFHIDSFWAFLLLALPTLLFLAFAVGLCLTALESLKKTAEGRKRCAHGIRKASEHLCAQCSAERSIREKEFAKELAEKEARAKRLAESKALRAKEIARLSKAWLARSDSYFSMNPREFEDAVARLFIELGYEVEQTPYSNDGGKDAIVSKEDKKYVVECKRYGRGALTGRRDLQILIAAMHDVKADGAFFISTGRFARTATDYAQENSIRIYDGDHLPILVNEAFGTHSFIPHAKVMCELCGEIVYFDIFGGESTKKKCKNSHEVFCNIKSDDLSVATTLETPVCPNHRIPMRMVKGRWGAFWGCPSYPRCDVKIPLKRPLGTAKSSREERNPGNDLMEEA